MMLRKQMKIEQIQFLMEQKKAQITGSFLSGRLFSAERQLFQSQALICLENFQ